MRHPCGVAGSLATPDPQVIRATPLDRWLKSGHPQGVLHSMRFLVDTGMVVGRQYLGWASDLSDLSDSSDKTAHSDLKKGPAAGAGLANAD